MNNFSHFLSFSDSGMRFWQRLYQTNADSADVSAVYKFFVLGNLACIPFMVMIPLTYRFAHFGGLTKTISNLYINCLYFLWLYTFFAFFLFLS